MKQAKVTKGPKTDDELHDWIKENLGMDIPRKRVCPDHQSPFEFLADIYFERVTSAIAVANRGGAKTMISAIIHLLNSLFKPGCESASVGAVEQQSQRAYGNLKILLKSHGKVQVHSDHPDLERSVQRETIFKNGSVLEVIIGTPAGVNGPHPQKVHTDEVELMHPEVFQESRNMSQSKDGIMAQDWITSTRKRAHGPMQKLLDENIEAERAGADPPYSVYTWCVFESAKKVKNCQVANPSLPEKQKCGCHKVVKGTLEDGSPRRFSDVCGGRLAQSDGFLELHDIHKTFRNTDRETYEAQQLCAKPETSGLVFPMFDRARYGIKWFVPDPDNGMIYTSTDFGGTNPHSVHWYQVLEYDVDVYGFFQTKEEEPRKRLKAGTRVCFDEIYVAEGGNVALANMVVNKEVLWKKQVPGFRVAKRFADVQAKAARLDWAAHTPSLPTVWYGTRDIPEQIKVCREFLSDDAIAVDTVRCPMWCEEAEAYRYPRKSGRKVDDPEVPVDDFNHAMSDFRYFMINIHAIERRSRGNRPGERARPATSDHIHRSSQKSSAPRYLPREHEMAGMHPLAGRRFE
jgi:hypothetical protein